ncbi:hypothetical protein SRHO_G00036490 [Serrasalmus rhombeus]
MSEASVQMLSTVLGHAGGFSALPRLLSTALSSTAMLSASSQPLYMVSVELHKCQGLGGGLTAGEVIIQVLPTEEEAEKGGMDWSMGERDGRDVWECFLASWEVLFTTKSRRVTAIGLDITTPEVPATAIAHFLIAYTMVAFVSRCRQECDVCFNESHGPGPGVNMSSSQRKGQGRKGKMPQETRQDHLSVH